MTDNPRATIGGNNPPEPIDGFKTHIEDLLVEAQNFLDGSGVNSEAEADGVSRIIDELRTAKKDADAQRRAEKKPHDDAGKAVQAKWKPILERADMAVKVAKDAMAPWLKKLEAERLERERLAREEAERKAEEARKAHQAAQTDGLAARAEAEAKIKEAEEAEKAAAKIEREKTHAKGGARAIGLRTHWTATIVNRRDALNHYVRTNPDAFVELIQKLADADARAKKHDVPGVQFTDEKVAA
ncbi:hypothetical protein [Parasphingopyxis sp.]|uniref:hypothetical protein n=1 Tax=Parasphingopyxis sp. TaxID=1920299 RepID=UPI00260C8CD6|nr:hypothetical protein [Parasphingopyxis sp.]